MLLYKIRECLPSPWSRKITRKGRVGSWKIHPSKSRKWATGDLLSNISVHKRFVFLAVMTTAVVSLLWHWGITYLTLWPIGETMHNHISATPFSNSWIYFSLSLCWDLRHLLSHFTFRKCFFAYIVILVLWHVKLCDSACVYRCFEIFFLSHFHGLAVKELLCEQKTNKQIKKQTKIEICARRK